MSNQRPAEKGGGVQPGSRPRPDAVGSKSEREKGQRPNRDKVAAPAESLIGEVAAAEEQLGESHCSWLMARRTIVTSD